MASAISAKLFRFDALFPPQNLTASANGTGVDLKGTANPGVQEHRVRLNIGTVTGTSPTLVVKMQDSPDNSVWTDIAGATTASLTTAGAYDFYFRTANRYVRAVTTITGTTPVFPATVDLVSAARVA